MKRKVIGLVLCGIGAFLLVAGAVAVTWAPGVVKKTPIDVNTTTHLEGTVKKLNTETNQLEENPVKVLSITRSDTDKSTDDVAVFVQSSCVVIDINDAPDCVNGDDPRLVSADTDVFATDRKTALAVPDFPGLPEDAVPHEGLVNKWPFDAEKKTYPYWEGTIGRAVDAKYDRTETLDGIKCYVYTYTVSDEPIQIGDGISGTYDNSVEIWVEPRTGAVQQQTQDQQRYLDDGTQVLDLKIGFTDDQIKTFADDARSNIRLLDLVTLWVPIVGFVGGALCLLAGLTLLIAGRRNDGEVNGEKREMADASS